MTLMLNQVAFHVNVKQQPKKYGNNMAMTIKVVLGPKVYVANDPSLTFEQLLKNLGSHFGLIPDLDHKITYQLRNKVMFIVDEATFQLAGKTFPKELCLSIQEGICIGTEPHIIPTKCFSAINGVDAAWDQEEWLDNILKAQPKSKLPVIKPIQPVQQEFNKDLAKKIALQSDKSQRFGHTTDLIESFMMSCFHVEARNKGLKNQEVDKTLWNLNLWRKQQRKQLKSIQKPTINQKIVPILKLGPKNHNNIPNVGLSQQRSPGQQPKPQEFQQNTKIVPKMNSDDLQLDNAELRYYLMDEVYRQLSLFAQGKVEKPVLGQLVGMFRRYTDEDVNFLIKVFDAYAEYSKNGVIYYPPTSDQQGMLPFFDDNEVIGILGDWGTGEVDANCLLDDLVYNQNATIILHLGDVYYAGFPEEFQRITSKINQLQKERPNLRYYTIPGNHDYYTFGGPFYNHLKRNHLNPSFNQEFGFFCLRNKSQTIQFIGLNTGKNEHDISTAVNFFFEGTYLEKEELLWAIRRIEQFPGKTILLTHHQLFSSFEAILGSMSEVGQKNPEVNNKLATQLFEVIPKLTCWLWGHEHRFSTYKSGSFGVNRSILAGNSSFQNDADNFYQIKYECDKIVETKYHPQKGELGYYHHTGITMRDFMGPQIKAKYIYMTSSFDQPSIKVKELTDTIAGPIHLDIQYKKTYQMLEFSGLSITFINDDIRLDSEPANLQFINADNPKETGKVNINDHLLIQIENTPSYLYYSTWGYVEPGQYENEYKIEKQKYLWKLVRRETDFLKTGDIFTLFSVSRGQSMARETHINQFKLSSSENPSKFFLYTRQTTHLKLDQANQKCCCDLM